MTTGNDHWWFALKAVEWAKEAVAIHAREIVGVEDVFLGQKIDHYLIQTCHLEGEKLHVVRALILQNLQKERQAPEIVRTIPHPVA